MTIRRLLGIFSGLRARLLLTVLLVFAPAMEEILKE
jgi:hypothetical protein